MTDDEVNERVYERWFQYHPHRSGMIQIMEFAMVPFYTTEQIEEMNRARSADSAPKPPAPPPIDLAGARRMALRAWQDYTFWTREADRMESEASAAFRKRFD
jgi:hypothetical protein